jgi:hypothetical protein
MENLQTQSYLIASAAWSAGNPLQFLFQNLPKVKGKGIPHVISLDIVTALSPAYTTAPTTVGINAAIANISIKDGQREWFPMGGSGNMLRAFERLESGRPYIPEGLLGGGTGNPRYTRRRFYWNPPKMNGQPADGAYNLPFLSSIGGGVFLQCGALTDISADCTACTGTVYVFANVARFFNKLVFPAYYPRYLQPLNSGQALTKKALYGGIALLNSTSFDAFAAGDVGNVTLDNGGDVYLQTASSQALTAAHNADMDRGQIDSINGDPANATYDVNQRRVNLTTPTALEAQALDLQAIQWTPPGVLLTKLGYVPQQLTITVSGSNSGTQQLLGRFEEVPASDRASQLSTALANLEGRRAETWGLRLLDGGSYDGPLKPFFPWEAGLNPISY